uniref:Uncharacterized protein n=1 Tax=Arundo donax TaxID=35708 RepID=A0A0A9EW05_ARUDO
MDLKRIELSCPMPMPLISHLMWLRIMLTRPNPRQHLLEKNATNQSRDILHH